VHQKRAGSLFFTPETVQLCLDKLDNQAKYTPKRQIDKPYKAVEVCRGGSPEVHRGYRSN